MWALTYNKETGLIKNKRTVVTANLEVEGGLAVYYVPEYTSAKFVSLDVQGNPIGVDKRPASYISLNTSIISPLAKKVVFNRAKKGIGDVVSTLSAVQTVRSYYPNIEIVYIGLEPIMSILGYHPDIDVLATKDQASEHDDGVPIILDHPCPCGEYESTMKDKTDKSRNEIFTMVTGLPWGKERPRLYLSKEEQQWGHDFCNLVSLKADYHVHIGEEDGYFEPSEWLSVAITKGLDIVGVNTHNDVKKSLRMTLSLSELDSGVEFVPVTEVEIKDDKRKFHLLCINPDKEIRDCTIDKLSWLKTHCDKLVLAHPKYDYSDFVHLLDGVEEENGKHKCTMGNDSLKKYKGSDAHKLAEWASCDLYTEVPGESTKSKLGVVLRTAEFWKDWPHVHKFIELAKEQYEVYIFDQSQSADDCINVVGYSLREVMSILPYMDCVVTPDTGILHLCDALDVPVIGLFGSMSTKVHINKYQSSMEFITGDCPHNKMPCWYQICSGKGSYQPCMESIAPEDVLDKVNNKISTGTIDNVRLFR